MSCPLDPSWSQLLMYLFPPVQSLCCRCQQSWSCHNPQPKDHVLTTLPVLIPCGFRCPDFLPSLSHALGKQEPVNRLHSHSIKGYLGPILTARNTLHDGRRSLRGVFPEFKHRGKYRLLLSAGFESY